MSDPAAMTPAERALSLLFRKLHPHLEDAAHALARDASRADLERLHLKLIAARLKAVEVLEADSAALPEEDPLGEVLDTLAANLTPVGESYRQALILTQLCLEEGPADLLPHAPEGCVAGSSWGPRMAAFLGRLEDPAFQARRRWEAIDEEIGETEEG
ncbi:hypothetical protein GETHPA_13040 [Geothrix rubra]|uniref:Uncharacterized protein n=1 Tax=Geothrix rubra TaxID=2927977 RepID=A0ABQ5Q5T9_9BACT|nr:hypothetical protein [Geothrix rubra]GLH69771.1 hypothetical protein GETHPA_13040 [Geothrix rubra]